MSVARPVAGIIRRYVPHSFVARTREVAADRRGQVQRQRRRRPDGYRNDSVDFGPSVWIGLFRRRRRRCSGGARRRETETGEDFEGWTRGDVTSAVDPRHCSSSSSRFELPASPSTRVHEDQAQRAREPQRVQQIGRNLSASRRAAPPRRPENDDRPKTDERDDDDDDDDAATYGFDGPSLLPSTTGIGTRVDHAIPHGHQVTARRRQST